MKLNKSAVADPARSKWTKNNTVQYNIITTFHTGVKKEILYKYLGFKKHIQVHKMLLN